MNTLPAATEIAFTRPPPASGAHRVGDVPAPSTAAMWRRVWPPTTTKSPPR
ncbi:MAG: hypothetical protein ACRDJ4_07800 [Actinomycetota bacterium]